MDTWASRAFLLYLLLFVFTGAKGQQCDFGWFGNKCQYQCHCLYNAGCDKTTGECPGDCDREWFGPQCQYRDAAYEGTNSNLVDGSLSKCLVGKTLYQDFPMSYNVTFTWMRIVTNKPGVFDNVTMTFYLRSGAEINPKSALTYILVNPTILEIHGALQDRLRGIGLTFDTPTTRQSFCIMQVSAGRNVAIKQNAYQSSTDQNNSADKAVDGKPNHFLGQGSCTSTQLEDSSYWALNLSMPATVNMYTILNIADWPPTCALFYFRLDSYYQSTKVQQYDETKFQNVYDVDAVNTSPITSVTLTVRKNFWPVNSDGCENGKTKIRFCEMQIFGDVDCPRGQWGLDCEKVCKCQNSFESCFGSTGMCPSGCKAGFQGPGCQEECDAKYYGENCAKLCSDKCKDQLCHHVTGVCESCPDGKLISLDCSKDCSPGFFGPNCTKQCSEHCGGDGLCNNIDGRCLNGCKPGYRTYNCEQTCDYTTYGEGCKKTCSVNCVVNATQEPTVCKHVNGQCLLGCISGYSGITCEEIPSDPDKLNLAIIVVPIVLVIVVVTALVIGTCIWRRRKAQQAGGKVVEDLGSTNEPDGVKELGVHPELENQSSNVQDVEDDQYERIRPYSIERAPNVYDNEKKSPNVNKKIPAINKLDNNNAHSNVENPPIHEYDEISLYANEENAPYNQYEKIGENRESHVYTEPDDYNNVSAQC